MHGNLVADLKKTCKDTDRWCAALIQDLKRLDNTLVIWGGEFGRSPLVQGGNDGRDHHLNPFTIWMAGGGGDNGRWNQGRGRWAKAMSSDSTRLLIKLTCEICTPQFCTCRASTTSSWYFHFRGSINGSLE